MGEGQFLGDIAAYLNSEGYKARRDATIAENAAPKNAYEGYKRLLEDTLAQINETSVNEPIDSLKRKTKKAIEYLYALEIECELHHNS
jgi:hypothetical protein